MTNEPVNRLNTLLLGDPKAKDNESRDGYLKTKGLSVEQFARKIGVSRTAVYFYLSDSRRPTLDTLVKICKVVGIPLSEGYEYCTPRSSGRQPTSA